jgi:hypothetical protein
MARYNPDHTAHIRRLLGSQATYGVGGLLVTAAAVGTLLVMDTSLADAPLVLRRLVWIAVAVAGGLSLLVLVVTGVMWLVYPAVRRGA